MDNAKRDRSLIWSGLLLIGAALCILGWSVLDEQRAARSAQQTLEKVKCAEMQSPFPNLPPVPAEPECPALPEPPDREMPVTTIDGVEYLGTLEIPALELELPIISQWSDSLLKIAPCRYKGSAYLGDLILAGHNYRAHFSRLKNLQIGDAVIFTDAEGTVFRYAVSAFEQLPGTAICEMESGEWELTLFTCTAGGTARFTVRCKESPAHTALSSS